MVETDAAHRREVAFVYDELFLQHRPPLHHPERPDRLRSIEEHLRRGELWDALRHPIPVPATEEQILAVHSERHLENVRSTCASGGGMLDDVGDTHASPKSLDVALTAAGAVITAVDEVLSGKADMAFCAVRPPGHHAEHDRAMGFCIFNNVAVGARYAQQRRGIGRVAVLDWDVHHGNGTQHIFEDDPTVLYISLHQYPFYPGTGAKEERGIGSGEGYTMNFPLPAGTEEREYLTALTDGIMPALRAFEPGLLLISAGFDAHRDDPLGGMRLTEESFAKMTAIVRDCAPIVSVLEGGYDLNALTRCVDAHLRALG